MHITLICILANEQLYIIYSRKWKRIMEIFVEFLLEIMYMYLYIILLDIVYDCQ